MPSWAHGRVLYQKKTALSANGRLYLALGEASAKNVPRFDVVRGLHDTAVGIGRERIAAVQHRVRRQERELRLEIGERGRVLRHPQLDRRIERDGQNSDLLLESLRLRLKRGHQGVGQMVDALGVPFVLAL